MANHKPSSSIEVKDRRFFYGYTIILASFLIFMIMFGAQNTFSVFFKPVLTEFGWTRAATSGAYALNTVLIGVFGIFAGSLSDRFGPRLIVTACGLFMGLGYLLMSQISTIWQMYLCFGVLTGVGLSGITVPLLSTIARWFVKRRGIASGLAVAGTGIGTIVMPPLANQFISSYSWRISYIIIGLIVLAVTATIAQFLKRDPGQMGLCAYGTDTVKIESPDLHVHGYSVRKAIRFVQFGMICTLFFCMGFCFQTVMVHIVPHATDIGVSAAAAAIILSVAGVSTIASKLTLGGILDRIGSKRVAIIVFALMSVSFLWLLIANDLWMLYLFAVAFGITWGGSSVMQSPLVAELFGLLSHGAIFGLASFAAQTGGAVGSLLAGRIYDITGSYYWSFILCAVLGALGLTVSIILKAARH